MKWLLVLGLAACSSPLARAADSPFAFKEISATGLQLSENGKPVYVYNFGIVSDPAHPTMPRSTYLHPVYTPDGTVLTDDFNKDHPHHRGIFWAWEVVTVDGKKDDLWTVKGFREHFVAWQAKETLPDQARLAVENGWYDGERKFVKENVEIVTHPAQDNRRVLDFTLSFEATDKPVEIVGTPDSKKGYGGFAIRTAPRDGGEKKTLITTDKGVFKKDGILAQLTWAQVTGLFHGQPEGVRIDDDPANPGYPKNGWLLRHGFAMLNVSYPGLKPVVLEPGKPLVLKYKVTLLSGDAAK